MGTTIAVTRFAADTGGGDQDITTADLGGLTPSGVLFIGSGGVTDGTPASDARYFTGATDGTIQWVAACSSEDGLATTSDCYRRGATDECIMVLDAADGSVEAEANFKEFIENGVTITWGNAPGSEYLITAIFFAGTDVSCYANKFNPAANEDDSVDVNTVGFQPDLVLVGGNDALFNDTAASYMVMCLGVVADEASVMQGCMALMDTDNAATSNSAGYICDSYGYIANNGAGNTKYALEFSGFDADGFTATTRLGNGDVNDDIGYLAVKVGVTVWAGVIDTKTDTGDQAYTGPNFQPQAVGLICSFLAAEDAWAVDGTGSTQGYGAFDADDEYCVSQQTEDGQTTTDTQCLSDDTALNLPQDDGAAGYVAAFKQFDATGFTLTYSTADGTARKIVTWAVKVGVTTHTGTFTADAVVKKAASGSITADSVTKAAQAGSVTGDAVVKRAGLGGSVTGDAIVKRVGESGSVTCDAIAEVMQTGTFTADAVVKTAQTDTLTADATIKSAQSSSMTADAVVKVARTSSVTADAVVKAGQTASVTVDAIIKAARAGSITADATIKAAQLASIITDGVVEAPQAASITADAIVKAVQAASVTADATIEAAQAASITADAVVEATQTGTFTTDAIVKVAQAGSITADAIVRQAITTSVTADAIVKASRSASITSDATVEGASTATFTADAIVRVTVSTGITADAAVQVTQTGTFTADAFIQAAQAGSITADAIVRATQVHTATADAVVEAARAGSITADATIRRTGNVSTIVADAKIVRTYTATITADAHIIIYTTSTGPAPRATPWLRPDARGAGEEKPGLDVADLLIPTIQGTEEL